MGEEEEDGGSRFGWEEEVTLSLKHLESSGFQRRSNDTCCGTNRT